MIEKEIMILSLKEGREQIWSVGALLIVIIENYFLGRIVDALTSCSVPILQKSDCIVRVGVIEHIFGGLARDDDGRHLHGEAEGAAFHFARSQPDLSSVAVAQVLADDQTQTHSLVVHLVHIFELAKLPEQPLLVSLANADSSVLDLDQHTVLLLEVGSIDLNEAVFISELHRILNQVDEHLLQTHLVAVDELGHGVVDVVDELLALHVGVPLEHQVGLVHDLVEVKLGLFQREKALLDARQIEQVVDEAHE
mmetsp:Transcript_12214/g.16572  ORF Transcript_12214/g.16572 Transcript_12214/m.16572 type:complete len:252 (-) Transcript_12214:2039-2794(-)